MPNFAADKWASEFAQQRASGDPETWAHSFEQQHGINGWASEFEQVAFFFKHFKLLFFSEYMVE